VRKTCLGPAMSWARVLWRWATCSPARRSLEAIAEEYQASRAYAFEDRLLRAVEAGRDAGGQEEGQCWASLLTFGRDEFSRCDLRVDLSAELSRVCDFYAPSASTMPICLDSRPGPVERSSSQTFGAE
jgi:Family of unknown function (DUF1028)